MEIYLFQTNTLKLKGIGVFKQDLEVSKQQVVVNLSENEKELKKKDIDLGLFLFSQVFKSCIIDKKKMVFPRY